jgi:hypothetical protein
MVFHDEIAAPYAGWCLSIECRYGGENYVGSPEGREDMVSDLIEVDQLR